MINQNQKHFPNRETIKSHAESYQLVLMSRNALITHTIWAFVSNCREKSIWILSRYLAYSWIRIPIKLFLFKLTVESWSQIVGIQPKLCIYFKIFSPYPFATSICYIYMSALHQSRLSCFMSKFGNMCDMKKIAANIIIIFE